MRFLTSLLAIASTFFQVTAWLPHTYRPSFQRTSFALPMALDYNDPMVAEELAKVQPLSFEEVEEELAAQGIPVSAAINEFDMKLMLVEFRLRTEEKNKKKRPEKFSSKLEEAIWTKPAFEEFYGKVKDSGNPNDLNVVSEYMMDKDLALQRYGKDYRGLIRRLEAALNAPPPVNSPTIQFSGFPANMGEMGIKMTLESIGAVVDFECIQDEDFPILRGKVTFEDIEDAKKAVAQYNGMDMGMGTALELTSV